IGIVLVFAALIAVLFRLAQRVRSATPLAHRISTPVLTVSAVRVGLVAVALFGRELHPSAWAVEAAAWLAALAVPAIALGFLAVMVVRHVSAGEALERLAEPLASAPDPPQLERAVAEAFHDPSLQLAFPAEPGSGEWID